MNDWQTCVGNFQSGRKKAGLRLSALLSTNQSTRSIHVVYFDLRETSQIYRRGLKLSFCEERFIYSLQRYSKQAKEHGGTNGQIGFRTNLSIFLPLSVSSLLFFCFFIFSFFIYSILTALVET